MLDIYSFRQGLRRVAPPVWLNLPNLDDKDACIAALIKSGENERNNGLFRGCIYLHQFSEGHHVEDLAGERGFSAFVSWLAAECNEDIPAPEVKSQMRVAAVFVPFGDKAMKYILTFHRSIADKLAGLTLQILEQKYNKDPMIMSDDEIKTARAEVIEPVMKACPTGIRNRAIPGALKATKLIDLGGGEAEDEEESQPKRKLTMLEQIASSPTMIGGKLWTPHRVPSHPNKENRGREWFESMADLHELGEEEFFWKMIEHCMVTMPEPVLTDDETV